MDSSSQVGQRRLQPLAADPVSSFPDHDQRLADRLIVDASALFYRQLLLPIVAGLPQQPDAMLAMVAGHRDELVQDQAFLPLGRRPVTVSDRRQQFLFCHLADASSHAIASPILGNILCEFDISAGQLARTLSVSINTWAEQNCTTGKVPDGHGLAGGAVVLPV